jgi:hypothetical protein
MEVDSYDSPRGRRRALIVGVDHNGVAANSKIAPMKTFGRMAYDCIMLRSVLQNSWVAPFKQDDMILLCETLGPEVPDWINNKQKNAQVANKINDAAQSGYGRPSRTNVVRALNDLIATTQPDDVVFIHFACHGGNDKKGICE